MMLKSVFLLQRLLHPFSGIFSRTAWVIRYQKDKTSLDGVSGCSGISWTICKQSAPRCRQMTMPTPRHSIFTGQMLFLTPDQQCQSTEGTEKHLVNLYVVWVLRWIQAPAMALESQCNGSCISVS